MSRNLHNAEHTDVTFSNTELRDLLQEFVLANGIQVYEITEKKHLNGTEIVTFSASFKVEPEERFKTKHAARLSKSKSR